MATEMVVFALFLPVQPSNRYYIHTHTTVLLLFWSTRVGQKV